ncbi:hypothetical protein [Actinomadura latina]|uniref:Uncharacterized protein n=1 Tax=Actinomadura latina TaxID=163603 RepID=A0A846YZW9_9ACTN|nr:hypothetical protein [Actinomadura latina]NKZ04342.1 hypothetical protein [Actinomadura latina]
MTRSTWVFDKGNSIAKLAITVNGEIDARHVDVRDFDMEHIEEGEEIALIVTDISAMSLSVSLVRRVLENAGYPRKLTLFVSDPNRYISMLEKTSDWNSISEQISAGVILIQPFL